MQNRHKKLANILLPAALMTAVLLLWEWYVRHFGVPLYILPKPSQIFETLVLERTVLFSNSLVTVGETLLGLLIAVVAGMLLAVVMDALPMFKTAIYPLLVVSQTVPVIVLAPIFIIYLGFGLAPKVLTVMLMCFFPIVVSFADGMEQIDPNQINLIRSLGAGRLQEYLLVLSVTANHYVNTQRYREAVALYTEILKHQPENTIALNNRAMILAAQASDLKMALKDINGLIEREGPLPMLVDTQAMVLRAAGKHQQALAASRRVLSEKPSQLDAASNKNLAKQWGGYYFHLALMCDANGDARGAADAMREAVALGFQSSDVFDPELPDWSRLVAQFNMDIKPEK